MPHVLVTKAIMHGGVTYNVGSKIEVSESQLQRLVRIDAVTEVVTGKSGKIAPLPLEKVSLVAKEKSDSDVIPSDTIPEQPGVELGKAVSLPGEVKVSK